MNKRKVRKETLNEMSRCNKEMANLEVGSEEYLRASKSKRESAEEVRALSPDINPDTLVKIGATMSMLYVTMIYSETRILDTRLADKIRNYILFIK